MDEKQTILDLLISDEDSSILTFTAEVRLFAIDAGRRRVCLGPFGSSRRM